MGEVLKIGIKVKVRMPDGIKKAEIYSNVLRIEIDGIWRTAHRLDVFWEWVGKKRVWTLREKDGTLMLVQSAKYCVRITGGGPKPIEVNVNDVYTEE